MADAEPRRSVSVPAHLRDQVASALRAALVTGELRPGAVYSAPALAERYGVSPTPVREAMLDLAREGMVEAVRNRGFRVIELSRRDAEELAEIRVLVEVPVVGAIARTAPGDWLEALRPAAERAIAAARERDLVLFHEADRRFHLDLLALAGNAQLVTLVGGLYRRARLYGRAGAGRAPGRVTEELVAAAREHVDLLDVMLAGEAEDAEDLMRGHIRRGLSRGLAEGGG